MPEKQEKESQHKPTSPFLNGVFFGTIFGAGAYYLFGTKKGQVSRKVLLEKGKKAINFLERVAEEVEEEGQRLKPKVEKLKKETESQGRKVTKTIEKLKKNFFFKKGKVLK